MGAPTDANVPAQEGDGESPSGSLLLLDVQERLAQVEAEGLDGLVAGVWAPGNGVCVVALAGEIDMANAAELTRALDGRLGPSPCQLIVELSRVSFIDSSGINELVKTRKAVNASGGEMVLAAPSPHVERVFEIVKLGEVLTIVDSLETAMG